jgi:hypothetical protein
MDFPAGVYLSESPSPPRFLLGKIHPFFMNTELYLRKESTFESTCNCKKVDSLGTAMIFHLIIFNTGFGSAVRNSWLICHIRMFLD